MHGYGGNTGVCPRGAKAPPNFFRKKKKDIFLGKNVSILEIFDPNMARIGNFILGHSEPNSSIFFQSLLILGFCHAAQA